MSADADPENMSDLAVMEVNEYKQKRRLESILDALDKVEERADEAWDLYVMGEIDHNARNVMILRAVQSAIDKCRDFLIDYAEDNAERTGSVRDDGARFRDQYWYGDAENPLGGFQWAHQDGGKAFYGLWNIANADFQYHEQWTETVEMRHRQDQTETRTETYTVPEKTCRRAFRRLNRFLNEEKGLDVAFEDTSMETWDYYDVEEDDIEVVQEPEADGDE